MNGKLIIISAPSGSGKTTIVRNVLSRGLNLAFSVSATSRLPRTHEKDGIDYYFMNAATFMKKVKNNEFLEWEEVYPGQFYGTLESEVTRLLTNGQNIVLDIDVAGGVKVKQKYGEQALALFIQPPSIEILRERLINRATDKIEEIEKRIAKASIEFTYAPRFDHVIVNDILEKACDETFGLIKGFID